MDDSLSGVSAVSLQDDVDATEFAASLTSGLTLATEKLDSTLAKQIITATSSAQMSSLKTRLTFTNDQITTALQSIEKANFNALATFVLSTDMENWSDPIAQGFSKGLLATGIDPSSTTYTTAITNLANIATETLALQGVSAEVLSAVSGKMNAGISTAMNDAGVSSVIIENNQVLFYQITLANVDASTTLTPTQKTSFHSAYNFPQGVASPTPSSSPSASPSPSATPIPPTVTSTTLTDEASISTSKEFLLNFDKAMNPSTLSITGTALSSPNAVWATVTLSNDRVTISGTWSAGSGKTLTLNVKDGEGNSLAPFTRTLTILQDGIVYVAPSGNDSNSGSSASPRKTIGAATSLFGGNNGLSTIKAAKGTYNSNGCIDIPGDLYGGYDEANWETSRDLAENATVFHSTASGGCTLQITGSQKIDGVTVYGPSGSSTSGINVTAGGTAISSSIQVTHSFIYGGSATDTSYGIWGYELYGSPVISNNTIHGQSADATPASSYGIYTTFNRATISTNTIVAGSGTGTTAAIYFVDQSNATLSNNILTGGSGTTSYGVYADNFTGAVYANTVNGGTGTSSYGLKLNLHNYAGGGGPSVFEIYNNILYGGAGTDSVALDFNTSSTQNPKIHHNKIHGGDASHSTTGIYNRYSDSYVYNNFIFAGASQNTYGISWIQNIDAPLIWNNTISGGVPGTFGAAIYTPNSGSRDIKNNLLFFSGGAGTKTCMTMSADADTGTVMNNGFDCPILHRSTYPTALPTPLPAIDLTTLAALVARGMGTGNFEISASPWTFATSGTPTATWGTTNYSITSDSSADIKTGGLSGPSEFTMADDFFGTARTSGWSIGAFEQNN